MKIKIIATIGESLQDNLKKKKLEDMLFSLRMSSPHKIIKDIEDISNFLNLSSLPEDDIKKLFEEHYPSFWNIVRGGSKDDFPCAELQSIIFLLDEIMEQENSLEVSEIVLIPTEETNTIAKFLEAEIENNKCDLQKRYTSKSLSIGKVITALPVEINIEDSYKFQEGLNELHKRISDYVGDSSSYDAIYIDISGGYKGFVPITSLRGFLDDKTKVFYAHQESKSVIIIPSLPLSFSLRSLDEMRSVIGGKRESISKEEWENLPHRFKSLYYLSPSGYKRNAFGTTVFKFYEEEKTRRYGYGHYLIELLGEKEKEKLEKKLPYWEHLWLGDQIPETVEHSRGHSMRLLELAYHLFQFFPNLKERLDSKYLYYLICAIWLHDIGHSALYYKQGEDKIPVYLLPSLVRDWHHLLSAQMIENGEIENGDYLDGEEDRKIVSLLAKYHRKMMQLVGENDFDFALHHELLKTHTFPPLAKLCDNDENLLLTCALLRLLDACDVQADRVISKEYKEQREKRTKYEIEFYRSRFEVLRKCKPINEVFQLKKALDEFVKLPPDNPKFIDMQREAEGKAIGLFKENWKKDHFLTELASLADRVIFKKRQELDFLKHSEIELVYLGKKGDDLAIYILPTEGYNGENLKQVGMEIREEYEAIKDILEKEVKLSGIYLAGKEERLDE